jgi:aryl-alcohol dehydrogenase-like predicted oxidoreductase
MVGGLMVRGEYPAMRRAVARALELGVSYFDTATYYGEGQSEANLGAVLRELGAEPYVGTKVRLRPADLDRVGDAVAESVEASLRRLGQDRVDLIQLHNPIGSARRTEGAWVGPEELQEALGTFARLAQQGKVRFWGVTAIGEIAMLHRAVSGGNLHTIQVPFNLLNPSAGYAPPPGFPHLDYQRLIDRAAAGGVGSIAIRILAGGALSGTPDRHPIATRTVTPIASGQDYAADVAQAQQLTWLVREGIVESLVEAAIRFAISKPELSTALIGTASLEQFEQAAAAANRGPLPAEVLARLLRP